jgi:hypothetical protein
LINGFVLTLGTRQVDTQDAATIGWADYMIKNRQKVSSIELGAPCREWPRIGVCFIKAILDACQRGEVIATGVRQQT